VRESKKEKEMGDFQVNGEKILDHELSQLAASHGVHHG